MGVVATLNNPTAKNVQAYNTREYYIASIFESKQQIWVTFASKTIIQDM